jgi:hypothetical protein
LAHKETGVSGIQEILVILAIVVVVLVLPGRMRRPPRAPGRPTVQRRLSGRWRLALLVSGTWPAALAVWLRPWESVEALMRFGILGVAPVAAAWALGWVIAGFRKPRA